MYDIDDALARILRAMMPALASAESGSRLYALPDGLELRAELGLDSISILDLALAAEKAFRVEISTDEMAACVTLGHLSRLIHNKTADAREEAPLGAAFKLAGS